MRWRVKRILCLTQVATLLFAALLLTACGSDSSPASDQEDGSSGSAQSQGTQAVQPQELVPPPDTGARIAITASEPQVFEGQGSAFTNRFDITDGILYLTATHQGGSDFEILILTDWHLQSQSATGALHSGTGSPRGLVTSIETSGSYDGIRAHQVSPTQLFGLTPGTYLMQVTADGAWKIELTQPVWDSGDAPPFNWSGSGDDVKGPIDLSQGTRSLDITHEGSSSFVIDLVKADGTLAENLVNGTGPYDGSVEVKIHPIIGLTPDIYGLIIKADGAWTVDFGE